MAAEQNAIAERSPATGTQTLLRGLKAVECVARGMSDMATIGAALGTPRSTTHRLLSSLVAAGYLRHSPNQGYLLGPMPIYLGQRALEQRPLVSIAQPYCEVLARQTGDTVHLGTPDGTEVVYLIKIGSTRGFEMRSRVGMRMPLATTGVGKALMLGRPLAAWRGLYDAAVAFTSRSPERPPVPEWQLYESRMAECLRRGIVFDLEENEVGIRCCGAPVRDASGQVIAAISVASAVPFMSEERLEEIAPFVLDAARAISRELGWMERQA